MRFLIVDEVKIPKLFTKYLARGLQASSIIDSDIIDVAEINFGVIYREHCFARRMSHAAQAPGKLLIKQTPLFATMQGDLSAGYDTHNFRCWNKRRDSASAWTLLGCSNRAIGRTRLPSLGILSGAL